MSVSSDFTARLPRIGFAILVGIAIFVAVGTDLALNALTPAKVAFLLGGVALLLPTLILRDPKAYWLFLLVLSIPFDISKLLSAELIDSKTLVAQYGYPASGTISIEIYLTDVVLLLMLLPWITQICVRKAELYFPKIGYLFLLYLAWSFLTSTINSISFYLSVFELLRESLYFLLFIYLVNNIKTRLQLRSVIWAMLIGFTIGVSSVIVFFEQGIGTDTDIFARLHDNSVTNTKAGHRSASLTLHIRSGRFFGQGGSGEGDLLRSQGMFRHPAIPASLCGLTIPLIIALFMSSNDITKKIALSIAIMWAMLALLLTFSRAGVLGLMAGIITLFIVGSWSNLISRRMFRISAAMFLTAVVLSIPFLLIYLGTRPQSFSMRFYLYEVGFQAYLEHPILGVGLNNDTAAMMEGKQLMTDLGTTMPREESADSYYLAVLMEVGPIGCLLLYSFFGKLVAIALRAAREAAEDIKPLLVGMIAGLASLATQNIADAPMAGHSVSGLLWLFAALIVAIARGVQSDNAVPRRGEYALRSGGRFAAPPLNRGL